MALNTRRRNRDTNKASVAQENVDRSHLSGDRREPNTCDDPTGLTNKLCMPLNAGSDLKRATLKIMN